MPQASSQRNHHLQRPGHPQDAADARPIELSHCPVSGMLQSALGSDQTQQLRRIDRFEVVRRDPIFERIERDGRQKAPTPRVRHVRRLLIGIEIVVGVPMRGRNLSDRIDPTPDVRPELVQTISFGKERTQADDGQRRLGEGRLIQGHSPISGKQWSRLAYGWLGLRALPESPESSERQFLGQTKH
jgi:hypothetical protein